MEVATNWKSLLKIFLKFSVHSDQFTSTGIDRFLTAFTYPKSGKTFKKL